MRRALRGALLSAMVLTMVFAEATFAVAADVPLTPTVGSDDEKGASKERAHDAGVVDGHVLSIDRAHGVMSVRSSRGTYDIVVLPSTTIRGESTEFHTIVDIQKNQHVRVFMSERAGVYYAQIIHLKP